MPHPVAVLHREPARVAKISAVLDQRDIGAGHRMSIDAGAVLDQGGALFDLVVEIGGAHLRPRRGRFGI